MSSYKKTPFLELIETPACKPGCEKMEIEWENGEEMEREWGNGERMRKWRGNGERMRKWREIHSQDFLILCLFPPSLSISYIKNCHILSQYGFFCRKCHKKKPTYALWKNNSGSNSLRESSASWAGLPNTMIFDTF